ncbi:nuclear transport factor 2 family protein [Microlunatus soli]|uniref:SnoaL-like domain-containing protein n=1 Tax=Microlunatus soli TaxID=630515 RepID=A0A1H1YLL8_9ACTN|nr:nuclear transport factor 2 family protein [Microlunatus soli]SDT21946.1 SnoaL-like domain-containing protein [Microlunatus soli]
MSNLDTLARWTRLWNGDLDQAEQICRPDFSIHFGGLGIADEADTIRTPAGLRRLIGSFRADRPGLGYGHVRLIDGGDHGVSIWNADRNDLHVGGIDVFDFDDGLISHVYSVTGQRPMSG